MANDDGDHQDLLQFLYAAPVGLLHADENGDVELINSACARWLMPLSSSGRLDNLYAILSAVAPGLRDAVARHGPAPGVVVEQMRIQVNGGRRRSTGPETIEMTLSRLGDRRLMAVFSDISEQVRKELALGDNQAHYRAVVSVLSEGIVLHDPQGKLLMCNQAAERMGGAPLPVLQSGAARAKGWSPYWPDGRAMADADTPTGAVLAGGPAQERVAVVTIAPSGEKRWFEVSAQPVVRPGTSELLAVVTSFTDVTLRQRLQDELAQHREHLQELVAQRTRELETSNTALKSQKRRLRAIADAVPGLISYWDTEQRCSFSNHAYLDWFGKTPEQVVGMHMSELLGPELYALDRPHVEAALRGEPQHFQRTICKHDGTIGHTLTSYIPDVADDRVRGFNVVVSDVTELKQAELGLADLNVQLQQRALQAQQATLAKSLFLANMSHEIRTPMNAIAGLSHLLRREIEDPLHQSRLQKIDTASQHLLRLINDILDLSKIEAGKLTLHDTEFDIADTVRRAVGMVSAQAREKSLDIGTDIGDMPRLLRGDSLRLLQCLLNLLANAVKFTEHGRIDLRVRRLGTSGERVQVRFEVQDTGPGIEVDHQAVIFHAFEQADPSSTRRHGGTGLGLTLTRHFARMMGGDVGVTSQPGAGSTFWFTASLAVADGFGDEGAAPPPPSASLPVPAAPAARRAGDNEARVRERLSGRRVLLVEDNPVNQEVGVELLELVGLAVETAENGARAVDLLRSRRYDLVLMDVQMPVMDGLTATRRIREIGCTTPIVAMTANAFDDERTACLAAGMADHLAKPVDPEALYASLLRWIPENAPTPASSAPGATPPALPLLDRLSAVPGLDLHAALKAVGGRLGAVEKLALRFTQLYSTPGQSRPLSSEASSVARLKAATHSVRGACAAIGARALQNELARFEQELDAGPDAGSLLLRAQALDDQLQALVGHLQAALVG